VSDEELMRKALVIAQEALASGDVPVGAIIIDRAGEVIASARILRKRPLLVAMFQ